MIPQNEEIFEVLLDARRRDEHYAAMNDLAMDLWVQVVIDHDTLYKIERQSIACSRYLKHCESRAKSGKTPVFSLDYFMYECGATQPTEPTAIPEGFGNMYQCGECEGLE